MSSLKNQLLAVLSAIPDPLSSTDIVSAGRVSVVVRGEKIGIVLEGMREKESQFHALQQQCKNEIAQHFPNQSIAVILSSPTGKVQAPSAPGEAVVRSSLPIPTIKSIVAVASGKGGVGKSTTTVNLARAFHMKGYKVGIIDADIYGPSIPIMLDAYEKPELNKEGKMIPITKQGIECISMGMIVDDNAALAWRGPMAVKALHQLLYQVAWHDKDIILVDMPPGTGDIHLSLVNHYPLSGAVIVTTPQPVAVADAKKCINVFQRLKVPILGVIENMSYYVEPSGELVYIFGKDGGKLLAEHIGAPLLGKIALDCNIRIAADEGSPLLSLPETYKDIALKIIKNLLI